MPAATGAVSTAIAVAAVAVAVLVSGCGGAVPTAAYEAQGARSAADAVSSGRTAVVAVDTFRKGMLTSAALGVLLQDAEESLTSASSSFDAVQPPRTAAAEAFRTRLDGLLSTAERQARDLRIAARRQDTAAMGGHRDNLARACDGLAAVEREHRS